MWYCPLGIPQFDKEGRRAFLNSDAIGGQFRDADVYDWSPISPTSNKMPCSRGLTDKNNAGRKGKDAGWKCKGEANCAELRENPKAIDNHHTQVEVENWENDEYRASWGGQTSDVRYTGEAIDAPIGLDLGEIENYSTDSEVGGIIF